MGCKTSHPILKGCECEAARALAMHLSCIYLMLSIFTDLNKTPFNCCKINVTLTDLGKKHREPMLKKI